MKTLLVILTIVIAVLTTVIRLHAAPLTLEWDFFREGVVYEMFRGIDKVGETPDLALAVDASAGDVFHVVAADEGWRSGPSNLLTILPEDIPDEYRITLYSGSALSRSEGKEEWVVTRWGHGEKLFWWCKIEKIARPVPLVLGWAAAVPLAGAGDGVVATRGDLLYAHNCGESAERLVNGVAFAGTGAKDDFTNIYRDPALYADGELGEDFTAMVRSFVWAGSPNPSLVLDGLVEGGAYMLQVFVSDDRTPYGTRKAQLSLQGHVSGAYAGNYSYAITCQFVASGTRADLTMLGVDAGAENISGFQLRKLP